MRRIREYGRLAKWKSTELQLYFILPTVGVLTKGQKDFWCLPNLPGSLQNVLTSGIPYAMVTLWTWWLSHMQTTDPWASFTSRCALPLQPSASGVTLHSRSDLRVPWRDHPGERCVLQIQFGERPCSAQPSPVHVASWNLAAFKLKGEVTCKFRAKNKIICKSGHLVPCILEVPKRGTL